MVDILKVATFLKAALDTGRSAYSVAQMIEEDELTAIVKHLTVAPAAATIRYLLVSLYQPSGNDNLWKVNKIEAIKRVRTVTGCGLKEAKDFVEAGLYGNGTLRVPEQQAWMLMGLFGRENVRLAD